MFINQDIEIDDKSANNKCIDCENNQQGFCTKNGKWAHLVKCVPDTTEKLPRCVHKVGEKYVATYSKDRVTRLGRYDTVKEAVKAIAKHEVKTYGKRRVNLDWKV